jgi:predicted nucleotidyltransferase
MPNIPEKLVTMIREVARALGDEMLSQIAFVGGCTTGLLITDPIARESVRYTQDVDLIIDIFGYPAWTRLQSQLRDIGFQESMDEGAICRMYLGELKVDFMPVDPDILGFSNRWYRKALATAQPYQIDEDLSIRLLTPPLFIATKLEAYLGRGQNDPLESQDIEDIVNLFDGRIELIREIKLSDLDIRRYIAYQIKDLLDNSNFHYIVESHTRNAPGRDQIIYERLEDISNIGNTL